MRFKERNHQIFITNSHGIFFAEEKPLTKCELDRKEALKDALIVDGKAIPPYDVYVPICEADGNFSLLQCNQFIGECWCVDEHGIEKKNTRTSEERPICHRK